jgi:hypothetical protein
LIITLIILNCTGQDSKFPQGAWKCVQHYGVTKDSTGKLVTTYFDIKSFKVFSEKNFSFIGQFKLDTAIKDYYGGGTYTLNGKHYEEKVMYHWAQPKTKLDWDVKAFMELKNDTLITTYPLKDNWELDKSNYNVEKSFRIK